MIDWNDAFDNSGYVPGADRLVEQWSAEAASCRSDLESRDQADLDLAYGPAARNLIDIFRPEAEVSGVIVFVHGGYWHKLDKSCWSHLARGALAAGWAFAIPSYTLAPQAEIAEITREIGRAVEFTAAQVPGPLRLAGHSAGGHLVSRMICDDSMLSGPTLARVQRVLAISGVYDLEPLTLTDMNQILQLTSEAAVSESPIHHDPGQDIAACFWVGAGERPEFLRQTRMMTETWKLRGARVRDYYEADKNHFSVIDGLGIPDSAIVRELTG